MSTPNIPNIPEAVVTAAGDDLSTRCDWREESEYFVSRAVLTAAWDALHPVVTTAEELDALPAGTVIRLRTGINSVRIKRTRGDWLGDGMGTGHTAITSEYILHWYSRVTVLRRGGDAL